MPNAFHNIHFAPVFSSNLTPTDLTVGIRRSSYSDTLDPIHLHLAITGTLELWLIGRSAMSGPLRDSDLAYIRRHAAR